MLPQQRPSILWRPKGQPSKCHEESAETEFQRYQQRLAGLQERAAQQEARLLSQIYPPTGQSDRQADQLYNRQAYQSEDGDRQKEVQDHRRPRTSTMQHPWFLDADDSGEAATEALRRADAQETMRQNMEMAEAKKQRTALQRARDQAVTATSMHAENTWWNYGAASEKWIPPEHRVRGRGCKAAHAEGLQSNIGKVLQWNQDTPQSISQASTPSCSQTAPYATVDNAPAPRRTGYQPTAPYYTEAINDRSLTAPMPCHMYDTSRAASSRPPFSLHEENSGIDTAPARPNRRDSRPSTARSSVAPYDRDDQPPLPPRRGLFRTGYHKQSLCPFDRDDQATDLRKPQFGSVYPYATSEEAPKQEWPVLAGGKGSYPVSRDVVPSSGVENIAAASNMVCPDVLAAGRPSSPTQSDLMQPTGARLSPASAKYAHKATTEQLPTSYPFVGSARSQQSESLHAPRSTVETEQLQTGRVTSEPMARRQAMQRSQGVGAAMHAYSEDTGGEAVTKAEVSMPPGSEEGGSEGEVASGSRHREDMVALVAKAARGQDRLHGSHRQYPWIASDAAGGHTTPREPLLTDGHRVGSAPGMPPYAVGEVEGVRGASDRAYAGQYVGQGQEWQGRAASGGFQSGSDKYANMQPRLVHAPAGVVNRTPDIAPIRTARPEVDQSTQHARSGRRTFHVADDVGTLMQHGASLQSSSGGEIDGMINELSRKYGAHALH